MRADDRSETRSELNDAAGAIANVPAKVWVFATVWFLITTTLAVVRVLTLNARALDLGFHTQAIGRIWTDGFDAVAPLVGFSLFDDHFSPLVLPLVPIVASSVGAIWLLVIQGLCVAFAIPGVWKLATGRGASHGWAWLITVMFAASPALLSGVWWDFHASVMAIPFIVMLLIGIDRKSASLVWLGVLGASAAREDMALVVFVLLLLNLSSIAVRERFSLAIPLASIVVARLLSDSNWFFDAGFAFLSGDIVQIAASFADNVWADGFILLLLVALALPWAVAGVRPNRDFVALLPYAAPLLLSSFMSVKLPGFHYYAVVPVFFAASAGFQPQRMSRSFIVAVTCLALVAGPMGVSTLSYPNPGAPQIVASSLNHVPDIWAAHQVLACLNSEQIAWSGPDTLVPAAGATAVATLLPLPHSDFVPFPDKPPFIEAENFAWKPNAVMQPRRNWNGPWAPTASFERLSEDYVFVGIVGDDYLEVWSRPDSESVVRACI